MMTTSISDLTNGSHWIVMNVVHAVTGFQS
jgi:hypothetical protein